MEKVGEVSAYILFYIFQLLQRNGLILIMEMLVFIDVYGGIPVLNSDQLIGIQSGEKSTQNFIFGNLRAMLELCQGRNHE